ncbi:hypothetical protein [Ramlibacter alkalitolerans]|uniref:Uncharacterized protein n=1 Tax=Ramlibacter alkalitolerans TaxID=2039631 RepID=A0ABS1JUI4_9BURK|nr:hypothetical protein [Ramlibacter alkalitolerans]MBL0427943.1 hypothetical protein [Ramlibacter alkalitolerans]
MRAFDHSKLADLRERHARLHDSYRGAASRGRELKREAAILVASCVAETKEEAAAAVLQLPADKLRDVAEGELEAHGIHSRTVRRILTAHHAAAAQQQVAEALASEVHRSNALMARMNEYACRFE